MDKRRLEKNEMQRQGGGLVAIRDKLDTEKAVIEEVCVRSWLVLKKGKLKTLLFKRVKGLQMNLHQ